MIKIALAVVAAVGLTFAADAQTGPLCQTPDGNLIVCHLGRSGATQLVLSVRPSMAIWLSVTPCTADPRRLAPSVKLPMAI